MKKTLSARVEELEQAVEKLQSELTKHIQCGGHVVFSSEGLGADSGHLVVRPAYGMKV